MRKTIFALLALLSLSLASGWAGEPLVNGGLWLDDRGVHINAHGGGVLYHEGVYYWFGEHKSEHTTNAMVGVNCYSSCNLKDWQYRGVALSVSDEQGSDIERDCVIERPKVIYNRRTGKFVMWFHLELKGLGYVAARAAVAVADRPEGPYTYLRSGRVAPFRWPEGMTRKQRRALDTLRTDPADGEAIRRGCYLKRDFATGQMSRDMTIFVDDDGRAYHIFSSEENFTLDVAELSSDYTFHTGRYARLLPGGQNEAPAIMKHNGTYWLITSGCTGWAPNRARMFSAPSIWGPWTAHDTPCTGPNAEKTFGGQGTYILKVESSGRYIFMADEWRPRLPVDSRYIWLPIHFDANGTPVIPWSDTPF